ncbi:MAG: hypothetical protein QJR10_00435 [Bacillota bacterium]|nr:hypothetical protein [Bacillota bacterium]
MRVLLLCLCLISGVTFAGTARKCYAPEEALHHANQDVCIQAHVYDVVEMADGTRFLDVCRPELPDGSCRFTILSRKRDRKQVGDLEGYRGQDITIRGTVHASESQGVLLLNDARQFHGGKERFEPNPALLHGFSAENGGPAFSDPATRGGGRRRSVFKTAH